MKKRGCSSVVEHELPKLVTAVRFRSPAPLIRILPALLCLLSLLGCTQYTESPHLLVPTGPGAATHRVTAGETLWKISQEYGVDVGNIVAANRLSDASQIKTGQLLVIPKASGKRVRETGTVPSNEFVWPVQGTVISVFGMRRGPTLNKGIDIQAEQGADVLASRTGVVSFVHENLPGFGRTVILDHEDGFATVYAYIDQILVQQGDRVTQHQVIAKVGTSGRTDVPALHFEIRRHQKPQNPFHYLP